MALDRWKSAYLELVGGETRGAAAAVLRASLSAVSAVYGAAVQARRCCYRAGLFRSIRLPGPVASVGNLSLGGTGKTPLVEWIARWCLEEGRRVAVLTRGYGRLRSGDPARGTPAAAPDADPPDDEAPTDLDAPERFWRLVGADRAAAGERAFRELGVDLAVLDDGFQHLRLRRDLDVCMVDATCPFGNGRLFPRGPLREPVRALARADLVVLSRADLAGEAELAALRARFSESAVSAPVLLGRHRPTVLREPEGADAGPAGALAGRAVLAGSGIGNPAGFVKTLQALGARVVATRSFPDHHAYDAEELRELDARARGAGAELVVVTEKDRVKLRRVLAAETGAGAAASLLPIRSVVVRWEFLEGEREFTERLRGLFPRPAAARPGGGPQPLFTRTGAE
ncbi:MAG: tetraacyldisaccharide 4'-kinase [Planctomycetes bacterium]|nr:tetraacyldisaccharide 4'-kinase [Planctomycetota bacterium]